MDTRFASFLLCPLMLVWLASCSPMPPQIDDAGAPDAGRIDAGPDSQRLYTYAGCIDDGGTHGCPRALLFRCALDSIRERHASCQSAADCVAVPVKNCIDYLTNCPPAAVNDAGAFLAEANAESERYCDGGKCLGIGSCSWSYQRGLVDCISGRCVALSDDGRR